MARKSEAARIKQRYRARRNRQRIIAGLPPLQPPTIGYPVRNTETGQVYASAAAAARALHKSQSSIYYASINPKNKTWVRINLEETHED